MTSTAVTKWHPATKLLLAVGALAVPYLLWTQPESTPAVAVRAVEPAAAAIPESSAEAGQPGTAAAPYVMPPLERFTAVVERPLFSPTRRMPDIPEPPPEQPQQQVTQTAAPGPSGPGEPDLRFFGTVQQNGKSAALVTYPSTNEVARLVPGDRVGPWEVLAIGRNQLVLGAGDERRTFEIFGASLRQPPAEAPAPKTPRGKHGRDQAKARGDRAAAAGAQEEAAPPDQGETGQDAAPPDEANPDGMGGEPGTDGTGEDLPAPDADVPPDEGDLPDPGADTEAPPQR
ncbi:hypothetical protein [Benzoatithermus flavus]|uniref:Type II secretion system protein GspC N-terminal domain-containing protein n=1 Tax=Benzoatithermus flavus TaxID=3108223 RepID=A0ABU8XSJ3_9PROT